MLENLIGNAPPSGLATVDLSAAGAPPGAEETPIGGSSDLCIAFDIQAGILLQSPPPQGRLGLPCDLAPLLTRILRRDASALAELHAACRVRLFVSAMRLVGHPELAGEIVSSALMQAWEQASAFDGRRANVITWLLVIVRSRALDVLRQRRTRGKHECALSDLELDQFADASPPPCNSIEQREHRVDLRRAMATLSPIQRQVLSMTFLEGRSQEETATHMGIPLGTVKSHARRGLTALRSHTALRAAYA